MSAHRARRSARVASVVATALLLGGCWLQDAAGPDRTNANLLEDGLTADNVGSLGEVWRGPGSAPVSVGATLYAPIASGGDRAIRALDARTGATQWETPLGDQPLGTGPLVIDLAAGTVSVSPSDVPGGLTTSYRPAVDLDLQTGAIVATHEADDGSSALIARRSHQALLYNPVRGYRTHDFRGYGRWVTTPGRALSGLITDGLLGAFLHVPPTLGTSMVWSPTSTGVGGWSLDTECEVDDDEARRCPATWTRSLDGIPTPVVVGAGEQTIYVGTIGGTAHALDPADGATRWSTPLGGGPILRPPALDGSTLFFTTGNGSLIAVDPGYGSVRWRSTPTTAGSAQPAVAGGVVYTASDDGTVRAFDADGCPASPCEPLWTTDAGGRVSHLMVDGGRLFVTVSEPRSGDTIVAYEP